ncbi:MAG TPA: transposase [Candidatus Dormibacteraeota bacterium]|nr:transposase [Candidatus Dormibacteraeota bacterium]
MKKRVAPSAALEAAIDELLSEGLGDSEQLAEVGRLGARLVLQRAVEEEVADYLGRARYERTQEARGLRNGVRPRRVQTAEGELEVQMPQLRDTADRFVSRVLPDVRTAIRTRPLEALIIGAYVRGLSDRDIESLLQEAGLGKLLGFKESLQHPALSVRCSDAWSCRVFETGQERVLAVDRRWRADGSCSEGGGSVQDSQHSVVQPSWRHDAHRTPRPIRAVPVDH